MPRCVRGWDRGVGPKGFGKQGPLRGSEAEGIGKICLEQGPPEDSYFRTSRAGSTHPGPSGVRSYHFVPLYPAVHLINLKVAF